MFQRQTFRWIFYADPCSADWYSCSLYLKYASPCLWIWSWSNCLWRSHPKSGFSDRHWIYAKMHVEFNDLHEIQSAFPYLYVKYSISEFHSMNRTFSGREDDRNALSCRCILIALKLFLFLFEIGCYGLPEDDLLSFGTLDDSTYSMIFKVSL